MTERNISFILQMNRLSSRTSICISNYNSRSWPPNDQQLVDVLILMNYSFISKISKITLKTNQIITCGQYILNYKKKTHQSLFRAIMVKQLRNENKFYTIFFNNQLCIKLLNNVTVYLKPVHAVRQCIDNGSFLKMTSFCLNQFNSSNNWYVSLS